MKIKIFQAKKGSKEISLPKQWQELRINNKLIAQVFRKEQLNKRQVSHTKDRSERKGRKAKPWRQKGTGRARAGSVRSPIWRKGGITFGPRKEQNLRIKNNKKMALQARKMLLIEKINAKQLILIEEYPKSKKTKDWEKLLGQAIKEPGRILMLANNTRQQQAVSNIPYLNAIDHSELNLSNLLNYDYFLVQADEFKKIIKNWE